MSDRQQYIENIKSNLDQWNAEIDKLEAHAKLAEADAKVEYQKHLAELKQRRADVSNKLDALRNASDEAWEDIKSGAEMTLNTMRETLSSVISRFN